MGKNFLRKYLWLILLGMGCLGFLLVYNTVHIQRGTTPRGTYVLFMLLFILIVGGISFFPNKFRLRFLLIYIPFLFVLGYLDQVMVYAFIRSDMAAFYKYDFLLLYPTIVLSVCFAYRLGGGSPGHVIKIGVSGLILLFSGFLDIMYFVTNNIPIKLDQYFAPHMLEIIGHVPSLTEVIIFISVHFIAIALFSMVPINKLLNKINLGTE